MASKPELSNCHQAPVIVRSSDEGTSYYECESCGQSCDLYVPKPKQDRGLEEELKHIIESAYQDAFGVAAGRKGYRLRHDELAKALITLLHRREAEARIEEWEQFKKLILVTDRTMAYRGFIIHDYVDKRLNHLKEQKRG